MGRHRWTSRLTVEECSIVLCAANFYRAGTFRCDAGTTCTATWTDGFGLPLGRIECRLVSGGATGLALYISPQYAGTSIVVDEQTIEVTTVRPHLGGVRFWFLCGCGKSVGRLYLPPGQRAFRCRHCHNLTYESAQTHDQRKYDLARNPTALLAAVRGKDLRRGLLGVGGLLLLLGWSRQSKRRQLA